MSETKHTPGPWHVHVGGNFVEIRDDSPLKVDYRLSREFGFLASMNLPFVGANVQTVMPDARLMAAAPDLLGALEESARILCGTRCYVDQHIKACVANRAAIAKATKEVRP